MQVHTNRRVLEQERGGLDQHCFTLLQFGQFAGVIVGRGNSHALGQLPGR